MGSPGRDLLRASLLDLVYDAYFADPPGRCADPLPAEVLAEAPRAQVVHIHQVAGGAAACGIWTPPRPGGIQIGAAPPAYAKAVVETLATGTVAVLRVATPDGTLTVVRCGEWIHPLVPGVTAAASADRRRFTFSAEVGQYGVVLDAGVAADARNALFAALVAAPCEGPSPDAADAVAGGIAWTASAAATGISLLASGTAWGLGKASDLAKQHLAPRASVEVSEGTKVAVTTARAGTRMAAEVSQAAISQVARLAVAAGSKVAENLPPAGADSQQAAQAKVVGKAALAGGLPVYKELQDALDLLVTCAADEGAGVVAHRYGDDAGQVARDGIHAVGNVRAIGSVKPAALAKAVGREAAAQAAAGVADASDAPKPKAE